MANNGEIKIKRFSYQPQLAGDSYQPIPRDGAPKVFVPVPPQGGTGARTIQAKPIGGGTTKK